MKALMLRHATWRDARFLRRLRNDPQTYVWMRSGRRVGWIRHLRWMCSLRRKDQRRVFIAAFGSMLDPWLDVAGTCGFEIMPSSVGRVAVVTVTVAPAFRGQGIGWAMMMALPTAARESGCAICRAEVRPDNAASLALFERAGYTLVGTADDGYAVLERPC